MRVKWLGGGPNKRFSRGRGGAEQQFLARLRLQRVGLLDRQVSIDEPPVEETGTTGERI